MKTRVQVINEMQALAERTSPGTLITVDHDEYLTLTGHDEYLTLTGYDATSLYRHDEHRCQQEWLLQMCDVARYSISKRIADRLTS